MTKAERPKAQLILSLFDIRLRHFGPRASQRSVISSVASRVVRGIISVYARRPF